MPDDDRIDNQIADPLDARLDAALRSYADSGETTAPRVALAQLFGRAARQQRSRRLRAWIAAAAMAAGAAFMLIVLLMAHRPPAKAQIAWMPRPPEAVRMPPIPQSVRVQTVRRHNPTAAARLPKQPLFPTPRPLSPEEQALVAFAQHGPPEVQRAVLQDQTHWDDPIIVAGLQHPLQPENLQDRNQNQ